ncbi:hypothetical protein FH972_022238 [Carpinus fangiana]|uniref:AP complex mu/sigma subunit domain-containing protein n=1 Tax=Carpinus fangiana TaxID=176857 RepID=A0A5N6KRP0_9ROSI|nr:hypothetical protein FH972_022238 [Carpinus fangiana]
MDKYYGNVCELDIIFNFQKAYFILDELLLAGEMQESSKKNVLRCINQQDSLEEMEYQPSDIPQSFRSARYPRCGRCPRLQQSSTMCSVLGLRLADSGRQLGHVLTAASAPAAQPCNVSPPNPESARLPLFFPSSTSISLLDRNTSESYDACDLLLDVASGFRCTLVRSLQPAWRVQACCVCYSSLSHSQPQSQQRRRPRREARFTYRLPFWISRNDEGMYTTIPIDSGLLPNEMLTDVQYLPLREIENVTSALNFRTSDTLVTGGCDLYTTKAAGSDKKLYKNIENSLESQHESLIRLSASLSPPNAEMLHLNLSRSSPFGPLSQVSSRRTFAYLIATLNASHPDYDFSHVLRPSDFRKERGLKTAMKTIDEAIYNVRPRPATALLAASALSLASAGPQTPGGSPTWSPRMWRTIDKEMTLHECDIYCYMPEEDPFDGEDTAIWSYRYLFFNKERKRVCYLYLRGLSMASHSPTLRATPYGSNKSKRPASQNLSVSDLGGEKRARYWLGDRAKDASFDDDAWGVEDTLTDPGDDEVDADDALGYVSDVSLEPLSADEDDDDEIEARYRNKRGPVRRMSEHMTETMEV